MLRQLAAKYRENLFGSVIPFWMTHSLDRERGGYFTCLDREGRVYDARKYIWLNGRQVWTLSKLYNTVEHRPEWLDAARLGAEFLRNHAFDAQGRCWFSLTREGEPSFYQRKPYGAAFVALGFLEYAKASGDSWYRDRAMELYRRIPEWTADASLLGRPALAGAPRYSGLADIYVECFLGLEAEDDTALKSSLARIEGHFVPGRDLLHENAPLDERSAGYADGRLICVGSIFEICWLLFRALDRHPNPVLERKLLACVEGALEFGWDPEHGGLFYFQDLEARPTLQLESSMKLWWVHVEATYCLIAAYARTRETKWLAHLERVDAWTWARFPDPVHGEWFGYLDREGRPALTSKGGNYKGCFHIPRALLFSIQTIESLG
jgi:N-acylglucosamine 2-epimerase